MEAAVVPLGTFLGVVRGGDTCVVSNGRVSCVLSLRCTSTTAAFRKRKSPTSTVLERNCGSSSYCTSSLPMTMR